MSTHYFIESKLQGNHVIHIKGSHNASGTPLEAAKQNPAPHPFQLWELIDSPISGFKYIQNPHTGLVIDIHEAHGPTPPPPSGTKLDAHTKESATNNFNNQLWKLVEDGSSGWYYIESLVNGYVIDVKGGSTAAGAPLDASTRNPPAHSTRQLWKLVAA